MRIILFGYYGYGNAGDEAVLAGLLHGLRKFGPKHAEYVVLSGDPTQTKSIHGVDALPRHAWRSLLQEAGRADAWIFGGGSLLQDVSGPFTMPFYLGVLSLLVLRKQRIFIHGHGIGPVESLLNKKMMVRLMHKVTRISLRDPHSLKLLQGLGVAPDRLHLGADLAFLLDPVGRLPASLGNKPLIGLALRDWPTREEWVADMMAALRALLAEVDAQLLLVPMDDVRDRPLALQIAEQFVGKAMIGREGAPYGERMSWIAECEMLIAMRLHAGIFAALAGVPAVLLSYDPKVDALGEIFGWECIPVDALTPRDVVDAVRKTWQGRTIASTRLVSQVAALKQLAENDLQEMISVLTGHVSSPIGSVRS